MKRTLIFAIAAVASVACAGGDKSAADTASADTSAAVPAPEAAPATGTTVERRTIHVVLKEWSLAPSETSVAAGPVTFHVMNQGANQHALEVERGNDEWETALIAAGGTGTVDVDLTPGSYTLYCPVEDSHGNHRQRGMRATLTVIP